MRSIALMLLAVGCVGSSLSDKPLDARTPQLDVRLADTTPLLEETGISGAERTWVTFDVELPAGMTLLTVETSGGSGDPDLYVHTGTPTTGDFLCRSWEVGSVESCTIEPPTSNHYVIGLYAYTAFSGVDLVVRTGVGGPSDGSCDQAMEPNNTFGEAFDIGPDTGRLMHAAIQDDDDWYMLDSMLPGEDVNVEIFFEHDGGDLDIELVDEGGDRLAGSASSTDGEALHWVNEEDYEMLVHLRVYRYEGETCQPYQLDVY